MAKEFRLYVEYEDVMIIQTAENRFTVNVYPIAGGVVWSTTLTDIEQAFNVCRNLGLKVKNCFSTYPLKQDFLPIPDDLKAS